GRRKDEALQPARTGLVIADVEKQARSVLSRPCPRRSRYGRPVSPTVRHLVAASRREIEVRTAARATERDLENAARSGSPLLLGPFGAEIGSELEYWIPFLRRQLRQYGIDRDQATVLTRGGAALWYRDFAAHAIDALELLPPEEYLTRLEARRAAARDLKQ